SRGIPIFGITNIVNSTIAKMVGGGTYLNAGLERGTAATKTVTSQGMVFLMLSLAFGEIRGRGDRGADRQLVRALMDAPALFSQMLGKEAEVQAIVKDYVRHQGCIIIGCDSGVPLALEAKLKFKELAWIFADAHEAAELKHGHMTVITEGFPVFSFVFHD